MQTILHILREGRRMARHGLYLQIENPPYMALVIEATGRVRPAADFPLSPSRTTANRTATPCATRRCASSLAKPIGGALSLDPFYWRNDYVGVEQWSRSIVRGHYVALLALHRQHQQFARNGTATSGCRAFSKPSRTSRIRG